MEPGFIFVGLITAIGIMHLAVQAGTHLRSLLTRKNLQTKPATQKGSRGDWYVFFHCADLLGQDSDRVPTSVRQQETETSRTQQSAPRQRLRL